MIHLVFLCSQRRMVSPCATLSVIADMCATWLVGLWILPCAASSVKADVSVTWLGFGGFEFQPCAASSVKADVSVTWLGFGDFGFGGFQFQPCAASSVKADVSVTWLWAISWVLHPSYLWCVSQLPFSQLLRF